MNERIIELAEQAFIITTDGKIGHVNIYMVEKFAELIIRECADFIDSKFDISPYSGEVNSWADGSELKKHFGVEE